LAWRQVRAQEVGMSHSEVSVVKRKGNQAGVQVKPADPAKQVLPIGDPPGSLRAVGKQMWKIASDNAKWLSQTDAAALYALCLTYQRYVEADKRYWKYLAELDDPFDEFALKMVKELSVMTTAIHRAMGELGLTPKARNDQGLAEVKLRSKMDDFMAKQHGQQQKKRYGRPDGNAGAKKEHKSKGMK